MKTGKVIRDKIMINLLPPARRKKIKEEESAKIAAIICVNFGAALIVFAALLFFIRVFYQYQLKSEEIILAEQEAIMKMRNVAAAEEDAAAAAALISKVSDSYREQPRVTEIFLKIAECLPAGASLSRFDFSAGKINIGGISPTREVLALFKNNLEKRLDFANVVFPASNWLAAGNVEFNASFDYVKTK